MPWRLVAGSFLHFVAPLYFVAILMDLALIAPPFVSAAEILHHVLWISPTLLGGYLGLGVAGTLVALLLDPLLQARRARRAAKDPEVAERAWYQQLHGAIARGKGRLGPRADSTLARLALVRWDRAEAGQQAIARDLVEAILASEAALSTATAERRPIISDMAADTLERIAAAYDDLAAARARHDEAQVEAIARYVENRYGSSDFAGGDA